MAKAFLKTAGGKSYLLNQILANLPDDIDYYLEPFLGGGSVFLGLLEGKLITQKKSFLSDINLDTMSAWYAVQNHPDALMEGLSILKESHSRERYLAERDYFNSTVKKDLKNIFVANSYIYLNHTCFNGLSRYNSSGKFNSPPGSYKNPSIFDRDIILNCNKSLNKTTLLNMDFDKSIDFVIKKLGLTRDSRPVLKKPLFVYLDPPYLPASSTANFTSYSSAGFSVSDHYRLKAKMDYLTALGAKVMLSNSKSPMTEFIFKGYRFIEVSNRRQIAAKGDCRKNTKEYLIVNY